MLRCRVRFLFVIWLLISLAGCTANPPTFDGERALKDVETQLSFGPRTMGSEAHDRVVLWMKEQLSQTGWMSEIRETPYGDLAAIRNVIAKRGVGHPWVVIGAHYDSRFVADQDPDPAKQAQPVPGANDGASGVAVLLELARILPKDLSKQVWLVFLDAEDNGRIPGWDWILGSRALAASFQGAVDKPDAVIIVDMIGDADLNIFFEQNSDSRLSQQIWDQASRLGHTQFAPRPKYRMVDDHIPFLEAGIPAVDLIDFDYPYWHTTADTLDKVSAESLYAVGDTLLAWLLDDEQSK